VKLKPDDGYYVDSLGWAYFQLGNLSGAVEQLERAVELKPDDPVINDHLATPRVGRTFGRNIGAGADAETGRRAGGDDQA
jgi:cytochrome c-type biogenesis protein CcmH/NrfG